MCPRCGMAKGVETARKTTSCQCGREIRLSRTRIKYQTDSPLELAELVAQANAALRGDGPAPAKRGARKRGPYAAIAESAKLVKDPLVRMRTVAEKLTELRSCFTLDDLRRVSSLLGKDSAEDMLARLTEHNLVYEIEPGKFRSV